MMNAKKAMLALVLLLTTPTSGIRLGARSLANNNNGNGNGNNNGSIEVDLEDVPIKTHRTAAQLLEDQVEQEEEAPTWKPGASFDPVVRTLYRQDMKNKPAYYEFRVAVDGERMGYIVVSSNDHDFPVPHWNFEGKSPTELLNEQAEGAEVGRYYKLDLTYVAEDPAGNFIAKLGNLPLKFESDQDLEEVAENADPVSVDAEGTSNEDDILPEEEEGNRLLKKEEEDAPFENVPWGVTDKEAWAALKGDNGKNYRFLYKSLKKAAAEDWDTDLLADTYGEGLIVGRTFEVALLFPDAKIQVSGRGAKHVSTEVELDEETGHQVLHVLANEADETEELPVRVRINYGNGKMEDVQLAIVPLSETPDDRRELGAWSAWTYFWADGGQRIYNQFTGVPNTSTCSSGCGATAWAMLFGWVDYRASVDSKWSHRWCAYRANGYWGGTDAVAPYTMDDGVKRMTWKIRNRIGTYCDGGAGRTKFSNMSSAYKYLQGTGCGWNIKTNWNSYGYSDDIRNKARDHIVDNKTPVIISDYDHFPLAYGYAWQKRTVRKCFIFCWNETQYSRSFYVNNGWGSTSHNGWITAKTRFAGRFYP